MGGIESSPDGRRCKVALQSVWIQGWVQHCGHSCNLELLGLAGAGSEGGVGLCRGTDMLQQVPICTRLSPQASSME